MSDTPTAKPVALVIEDDDMTAMIIQTILEQEGYEVQIAVDGEKAQQMIARMPPPALVTLDIMLPYIDGFELLDLIRSAPDWQDVPVLVVTSKTEPQVLARALNSGASDCLVKPFRRQDLCAQIKRLTGVIA